MQRRSGTKGSETFENYAKKKSTRYKEQDSEKVSSYLEEIADIAKENIAYVDECGIDTYIYREYGYAQRGEAVTDHISGRKYKRTSIVAAKLDKKIIAALEYSGTMNGDFFEGWFEELLLPSLPKDTVIVMDNASFHRKDRLLAIAEAKSYRLIFLPPYSPELNPIEKFWACLKRRLKKVIKNHGTFADALSECF